MGFLSSHLAASVQQPQQQQHNVRVQEQEEQGLSQVYHVALFPGVYGRGAVSSGDQRADLAVGLGQDNPAVAEQHELCQGDPESDCTGGGGPNSTHTHPGACKQLALPGQRHQLGVPQHVQGEG
ncbi:hypothetical protein PCANC_07005 [Puccinia coronata f. sp. avenae]|uniref:Uncharacterized protein n=1 Tax=Puccinia coronata f. sp. avenae TaxID=200324 RepID=A0A2N5UZJ7_9BASI|nr:hypothetical protein PCANC_07005 [Puccinia coronata f. sp. avenae]